jgi:hypothetical protein
VRGPAKSCSPIVDSGHHRIRATRDEGTVATTTFELTSYGRHPRHRTVLCHRGRELLLSGFSAAAGTKKKKDDDDDDLEQQSQIQPSRAPPMIRTVPSHYFHIQTAIIGAGVIG